VTVQTGQVSVDGGAAVAASVEVGEEAVSIVPEGGEAIALALVDITDLLDDNYTLRLTDHTGRRFDLSMLGKAYGQVVGEVRQRRDDRLQKELLLTGVKLADTYPGKLFGGAEPLPVEIRLFEDAIVVVPERAQMFGIPYSFVEGVEWNEELYQTTVRADDGQALVFGHLAKRSEEFRDELQRLMAALAKRTADTLQGLIPGVSAETAATLAGVMRDGRAAPQTAVDAIDPALWPLLETAVVGTEELRATYEHLKAMTPAGQMALGIKSVKSIEPEPGQEPPPPEQGDNHLWFFAPVLEKGNAIAHEITSEAGHATYLYRTGADEVAPAMAKINRAILTLNFRREPIYASDEEIQTGKFSRYRVAVRSLDYLRFARERFLGRAIHNASWAAQVEEAVAKG
jgi:hypothetical protein